MKRVHYTDSYLLVPQHPVTVNLIGGGGTGSQVLTNLARLDVTLRALGHPGLFVTGSSRNPEGLKYNHLPKYPLHLPISPLIVFKYLL